MAHPYAPEFCMASIRAHPMEIRELERELGRDVIFTNSALHLSSQATGPKIRWIQKNEPDVWAKTAMVLTGSAYLVFKLTGEYVIDIYTATAYAPMLDVRKRAWNPEFTEARFADRSPATLDMEHRCCREGH